jgi:predicted nucleic acid-binding protein
VIAALPDTSVWIGLLRNGDAEAFMRRGMRSGTLWLASVVMQELYVGASGREDKADLDRIRNAFVGGGYIVTPSFDDWCAAGVLLARYGRLRGVIDYREHLNDVLVLLCAAQIGAALITWNIKDMTRWNRLLPAGRRVPVRNPRTV